MDTNTIEEQAVSKETITRKRFFSSDEQTDLRKELTDGVIETAAHLEEIQELKDNKAERLTQLKKRGRSLVTSLRRGFDYEDVTCALIPNYETGKMEYYDQQTGELIQERKLLPNEKQLRISKVI